MRCEQWISRDSNLEVDGLETMTVIILLPGLAIPSRKGQSRQADAYLTLRIS